MEWEDVYKWPLPRVPQGLLRHVIVLWVQAPNLEEVARDSMSAEKMLKAGKHLQCHTNLVNIFRYCSFDKVSLDNTTQESAFI